jgi:quinol monooxygenase YgiN
MLLMLLDFSAYAASQPREAGMARDNMIIELVSVSVPHGKKQELGKALASLVGPIQVQRGCLTCRLVQGWPMQDGLQMEARWDSQADLVQHLQSDIYKRLLLLMELSPAPPVLEFFTVVELRGLDLVEMARTTM